MIQAFSHFFNFFSIASPCGDMFKDFKIESWPKSKLFKADKNKI
jgi:hypothetical protein